jgi:hypothetical protein
VSEQIVLNYIDLSLGDLLPFDFPRGSSRLYAHPRRCLCLSRQDIEAGSGPFIMDLVMVAVDNLRHSRLYRRSSHGPSQLQREVYHRNERHPLNITPGRDT